MAHTRTALIWEYPLWDCFILGYWENGGSSENVFEPPNAKTKAQIGCAVTAQLISGFVFISRIVQTIFFSIPKFQSSSLHQ